MVKWTEFEPIGHEPPIHCPQLQADIHPGTFVLFGEPNRLGRFLKKSSLASTKEKMVVNVFVRLDETKIPVTALTDCRIKGTTEVVQTSTVQEIQGSEVVEVAFCFSASTVSADQVFGLLGINNLFVLRFRSDHSRVSQNKELLFPCELPGFTGYCDDYSYRIFLGLRRIRADFTKKLGRYGMKQGFSVRVAGAVTVSREVWGYIRRHSPSLIVASNGGPPAKRRKIHRVLDPGMHLRSVREIFDVEHLHFSSEPELLQLQGLLGDMCLFEVRKPKPKLDDEYGLYENDSLNVIVSLDGRPDDRDRRYHPGVDFFFDKRDTLFIVLRYEMYRFTLNPTDGKPHGCPSSTLEKVIGMVPPSELEAELPVALDDEFEFPTTGEVFRVSLISSKKGEVKANSIGRSNARWFCIELIVPWIAKRLGLGSENSSNSSE